MNKIIQSIFLLIFSLRVFTQVDLDPKWITIHSPEAASLGQYGVQPVNMQNGLVDVKVPLYVIKSDELELPIYLAYHTSGIKLDQESTTIGLGWTLHAGGVINRIVNGIPDEESYGFLNIELPEYGCFDCEYIDYYTYGSLNGPTDPLWGELASQSANIVDTKPDLFQINTNNLNSSFYFINSNETLCENGEPLKINANLTMNQLLDNLIEVYDKEGNLYRFGHAYDGSNATERATFNTFSYTVGDDYSGGTNINGNNHTNSYNTSYYLTEIVSSDKSDTIFFKYVNYLSSSYPKWLSDTSVMSSIN